MIFEILPIPKPRMTQRDKWAKRPPVIRYRAFCDQVRAAGVELPESGAHVIFHMPMPPSWRLKKRLDMAGKPHRQKPDVDNLWKALMDACLDDDSGVWDVRATKLWAVNGAIEVNLRGQ